MGVVYYCETCDRGGFVARVLPLFREQLANAKTVFVKPNIVSSEVYPSTTHPEVLDAVLNGLSGHELVVGDGPAVDAGRSNRILRGSPLKEVCEKHGIGLVNLYSGSMRRVKSERGYSVRVSVAPLVCDFVVSVPVLKVHNSCGLSGALKNQFGYLSKLDRVLMHTGLKDIQKGIAEVNVAVRTDLFIVDAVQTMIKAQECRHGGCPADSGVMIAGTDPVSLDCFGLDLLQKVDPEIVEKKSSMKYIDYASEYSLGSTKYEIRKI